MADPSLIPDFLFSPLFMSVPSTSKPIDPYRTFQSIRGQKVTFSSAAPFVPSYVQQHTPAENTTAYTSRIQGRHILLENPARESRAKKVREAQRARRERDEIRRKAGVMSRREAKQSGAWVFDKRQLKSVPYFSPPFRMMISCGFN